MPIDQLSNKVWQDPIYFIAFGFGTGLIALAPGTWGSLIAIPFFLLMSSWSIPVYVVVTLLFFLLGVWICEKVSKDLGVHDFSGIVWDEVVGLLITFTAVPAQLIWIILGFLLFRLFDIWKPYPISWVDRHIQGGLGIMLDDVLAAIPAWLILQFLIWSFT